MARTLLFLATLLAVLGALIAPVHAAPTLLPRAEVAIDRTTPRRAMDGLLRSGRSRDFVRAAQCLDLRAISEAKRASEGPTLAEELTVVLDRKLWIDVGKLSDEPDGEPADGPGTDVVGTIELEGDSIPISLTRTKLESGASVWLLSKSTVAMIPALYAAYGDHWIADHLPASMSRLRFLDMALWQWLGLGVVLLLSWWGGQVIGWIVTRAFERLAARTRASWDDGIVEATRGPFRWMVGVFLAKLLFGPLHLTVPAQLVFDRTTTTLLVIAVAAYAIRVLHTGADVLAARLPDDTVGELQSRGIKTQLLVARRIGAIVIGLVACAVILIQFEFVRVGMSLLASAGIASVVVGIAAQKSLAGVIAGIQLSVTQPIRIGDFVVIENEAGNVEEINLTFVILKLWDERRMIVPIARFLETAYQNWTKSSPEILGTVLLAVDASAPVPALRRELARLCEAHPLWDKRICKLQVTDITERAMTLRALLSVARMEHLWDVRCDIREGLVEFLQRLEGGRYLAGLRPANVDVERIFTEPSDSSPR